MNLLDSLIGLLRPHHFRGKLFLLDRVVPHEGEREATVFDHRQRLDLGEAIQRWIYMGAFEPRETVLVRQWLRPGMTFLDVGANVGYFTLLAASRVGREGRVHAIEPSPYAFNRLRETVRANAIDHVKLHNVGFSDENGDLTLYVQPASEGFHSPTMSADAGGDPVSVPVRRLDEAFADWQIESVDLMKMDVEGHELHVLRGGSEVLSSGRVRAVLCEFNEHWLGRQGTSSQELYETFRSLGFDDGASDRGFGPAGFETRMFVHRLADASAGGSAG